MTTPVQHGHPDWSRTVSASDILVLDTGTVAQAAATVVHGRFFVGNLPYLWVRLFVGGGGARMRLHWYEDLAGGVAIAENLVDVLFPGVAEGPFAVLAPFVEVATLVDAAPRDVNARVWQGLQPSQTDTQLGGCALLSAFQSPVPGFTANTYNAVLVRWGWGHWTALFDLPASYYIRLNAVDYLGVQTLIGFIHSSNPHNGGVIVLPPQPIQIVALNNVAAGHVLTYAVLVHPGPV